MRGAGGWADDNANGYFAVGGVSGTTFQIIPGYVLGEGFKTFPVRGFPSGTLLGTRALVGSAEYRVPLLLFGGAPRRLALLLRPDVADLVRRLRHGVVSGPQSG